MKTNKITRTVVKYKRDGVVYSHIFSGNMLGSEAERRTIMELHIARSQIVSIEHQ